jgi:hypothetical protein
LIKDKIIHFPPKSALLPFFRPADRVIAVGNVSCLSAIVFFFASFFCGIVIEYNVRVGYTDLIDRYKGSFDGTYTKARVVPGYFRDPALVNAVPREELLRVSLVEELLDLGQEGAKARQRHF